MTITAAFWQSFNETGNSIDEHFSDFAKANDLTEEEADAIRTDVVATLIKYFAQMVEEIHQAQRADIVSEGESSIDTIFDYFCDSCLGLEEDTKELLAKSIAASVAEFADEDEDDDDDDEYQVKEFLRALVKTTPAPDKDYIDLDQDTDETPDPYGNHFSGGVKVFDRRANRYGHGPNEATKVLIHPSLKDVQNNVGADNDLKGGTPAANTLHPNSMPGSSHGLSVAHHAVPGLTQYCDDNDISCLHLGMGRGVQHFGFQNEAERNKAAQYVKQMFGQSSFTKFTKQNNESAALQAATDLEESITHDIGTNNHNRLVEEAVRYMKKTAKPSSYSDGAMTAVREQLQAQNKLNAENPLFDNDTSRDPQFLARLDEKRR